MRINVVGRKWRLEGDHPERCNTTGLDLSVWTHFSHVTLRPNAPPVLLDRRSSLWIHFDPDDLMSVWWLTLANITNMRLNNDTFRSLQKLNQRFSVWCNKVTDSTSVTPPLPVFMHSAFTSAADKFSNSSSLSASPGTRHWQNDFSEFVIISG